MPSRPPVGTRSRHALALAAVLWLPAAAAVQTPTITFVEGRSVIVSGPRGYLSAAGVSLRQCDIVSTGPEALVQTEFDDGGQIVVGRDSRMLFGLPGSAGAPASPGLLLSGWVKVAAPARDKAVAYRIVTPQFDLAIDAGAAVLHVDAGGGSVFVERGEAMISVPDGASAAKTTVRAGQTYLRKAGQPAGTVVKGIDPDFLKGMPRSMRDTLPSMLARLRAVDVQPQPAPGYDATQADQWFRTVAQLGSCVADDIVRSGQEALQRHGFDVGAIDGILGPRTRAALLAFQQRRGLPPSGGFDAQTLDALEVAGRR